MIKTGSDGIERGCDVIVVDDDADVLRLLTSYLTGKGIRTKGMNTGMGLAEFLARDRPRLVLLDVMMPVSNGYALYDTIKKDAALNGTKVYFISALPERNLAWYVQTNGAAGYITKPFSTADIDAVLAAVGISAVVP